MVIFILKFHSVRALNMKHTFELVFVKRYAMLFFHLTKWPQKHTLSNACFVNLEKWLPARMPCRVYRPVRPLVLIYNSMVYTYLPGRLGSFENLSCYAIYFTAAEKILGK